MSTTTRSYTIRLSAAGKQQLEADLKALGRSGEQSLRKIQSAGRPASAGLRETDGAARQLKGSLHSMSQELPAVQRLARFMGTTALAGGLVAFGKGALDVGRQFQAMMQRVEAATQANEGDLDRLAEAAKRLGETTAFSAMQAAEAIEVLAKNGVSVTDILGGALDSSVMLASALGAEIAPSADLVTDVMQQFGLTAAELPEIVDRLTGAAFTSKFGFDDLRLAIAQAGGVAGTTGVEINDFLTTLSATASSFASGSDAGTSYKTFLQRLVPESAKAAAVMSDLGLEFFDANGNMKGMAEIAQELQDGLAGLDEASRLEALKTVFGTDAIRTASALAAQGADGFRDLASAIGEVSAQEQAEVRMRGLDGALKELAAAWEALQLEAAQNGGLEIAEEFTRRLTEALRYLTENFQEVEEIVERVAQALTVYLVGKGMTLAVAKAVAMRAAYIELAGSVSGVGTVAGRAVGPMTRLGAAARVLTGVLGGPLSLAITAASLIAFGLDTDKAADAIDRADAAAKAAASALDEYQAASKRAADEQKELGGQVSAATEAMLVQTRANLVQALEDAQRELKAAQDSMSGAFWDGDGFDDFAARYRMLFRTNLQTGAPEGPTNRYLMQMAKMAEQAGALKISATAFMESFSEIQAIGPAFEEAGAALQSILDGGGPLAGNAALEKLREMAAAAGIFGNEVEAIDGAGSEAELRRAYGALVTAINEAVIAGRQLRSEDLERFRENAAGLAGLEKNEERLLERHREALDISRDLSEERPFDATADSAGQAADEIDRATRAFADYQKSRVQGASLERDFPSTPAVAQEGMRSFIAWLEGTAPGSHPRAKGYNTTLDYDRYTGPVNLEGMTLNQVQALQRQMLAHPDNPHNSSAVGMYQIVSTTLRGLIKEMGLTGNELFTGDLQDQMADRLIARRGRNPAALRSEWEGLNRAGDADILAAYDSDRGARAQSLAEAETQSAEAARERAATLREVVAVGEQQLEQLRLEASLAGRSVEEQARLRFEYEALNSAKQQGIDVDKALAEDGRTLRQVIQENAIEYARLVAAKDADTEATERNMEAQEDRDERIDGYKQQISGLFENLKPGGAGIEGFWDDLTSMILDKLWSLALDPVWQQLAMLMDQAFSGQGLGAISLGTASAGYSAGPDALASAGLYANGGELPRRAGGGGFREVRRAVGQLEGAGGKRQDNLLFWGSRGEFMQPADAVDHYGVDFMEAIRTRRLPKFADGGFLGGVSAGAASASLQPVVNMPVNIETLEGTTAEVTRTPDGGMNIRMVRQFMREELASGSMDGAMRRRYGGRPLPKGQ
ncbi:hypothetical protein GCM10011415_28040 [Salipiger pallidus]|uniref:Phage tail tape measure protein domain-containing protein n=1 Tax=Salipiger pallidus TaxID=1775170 RepID=A0A8J2ZLI4_9RHOB|nr:phage tail tape measure protein [Salipiger pallidus]GGG77527.1 hypothetical protein GCM10011415_28040 [Salipiger pallidus]